MREFKFRAWFKEKPKWCNQMFYSDEEGTIGDWFSECEQEGDVTFMQFTGLKDKNGKEIYEGDVVEVVDVAIDITCLAPIVFEQGCFLIKNKKLKYEGYGIPDMSRYASRELKVIGNIYQNQELLK